MGTRAAWLAWALAALSVAMFLASGVLHVLARSAQSPLTWPCLWLTLRDEMDLETLNNDLAA